MPGRPAPDGRRSPLARLNRTALATIARLPALRRLELELGLELRGARVVVPVAGGIGPEHRDVPDPHLLPILRAALALRDGVLVDVGAHTGQTLVKLLICERGRRYVGFEPQLAAAAYVTRLLEANRAEGTVVPAALGARDGPAELLLSGELDDGASVVAGFRPPEHYRERRVVAMLRGDEALEALDVAPAGVVKVDAEGAELEVLGGLTQTIARDRPVILCEVLPIGDEGSAVGRFRRERAEALAAFFDQLDYAVLRIEPSGGLSGTRTVGEGGIEGRDYVCVPAPEAERFAAIVPDREAP